jgi:hypothetical protein
MESKGVRVKINEEESLGYIVRRLDAESYEIATDDDRVLILSPNQFKETKSEE